MKRGYNMPGPGSYLIGDEEKKALIEVIEAGHLVSSAGSARQGTGGGFSPFIYSTVWRRV